MQQLIEQYRKSKETQQGAQPQKNERTLQNILHDKQSSHLFGQLLEEKGEKDVAERLAMGKLEEDDIELLEGLRKEFLEKMNRVEEVENLLTAETMTDIARNHPDFEKIVNLVGPERAINAIKNRLKELCIADTQRFEAIAGPIERYDLYKTGEYKRVNGRVEELCRENGISPEEYVQAINIKDPKKKEEALRELAKKSQGKFKRALDFVFRGGLSDEAFTQLKNSETMLEDAVEELKAYRDDIGSMLFSSLSGHSDMRDALSKELISEKQAAPETGAGFKDAKKGAEEMLDDKKIQQDWEEFKKQQNFATKSPADQDKMRDDFLNERKKKYIGNKKDLWSDIWDALSGHTLANKKKELK